MVKFVDLHQQLLASFFWCQLPPFEVFTKEKLVVMKSVSISRVVFYATAG